jgi:acyl carrier protein
MKDQIKQILSEIKDDESLATGITDDMHLMKDVGLTSLDMMRLMLELEEEFDIEIDIDKINLSVFESLDKLCDFITEMKK